MLFLVVQLLEGRGLGIAVYSMVVGERHGRPAIHPSESGLLCHPECGIACRCALQRVRMCWCRR